MQSNKTSGIFQLELSYDMDLPNGDYIIYDAHTRNGTIYCGDKFMVSDIPKGFAGFFQKTMDHVELQGNEIHCKKNTGRFTFNVKVIIHKVEYKNGELEQNTVLYNKVKNNEKIQVYYTQSSMATGGMCSIL